MAYKDFKCLIRGTPDKILPEIYNMMDIKGPVLQWFINFLIKILLVVVLKMRIFETTN